MVTQYGMSDELGPRVYGDKQELVFLGREISEQRDYSDAIAEKIDQEVREIIDTAHARAMEILMEQRDTLDRVAKTLLDIETLESAEFVALVEGAEPPQTEPGGTPEPEQSQPAVGEQTEWKPPKSLDLPPAPSPA
jgi:cell division protease FtsH